MTSRVEPGLRPTPAGRLSHAAARWTAACAAAVVLTALVVEAAWAGGTLPVWNDARRTLVMLPLTAAAFALAGVSLWLRRRPDAAGPAARATSSLLATTSAIIGAVGFVGRVSSLPTDSIGLLLFPTALRALDRPPHGLMAVNSGLCFVLAGVALITIDSSTRRGRPAQWLASLGLGVAAIAVIGHIYGAPSFYTMDRLAGMASVTAACFVALFLGILLARPDRGAVALLTGPDSGAQVARRLLPPVVLLPLLLGFIWIRLREGAYVSREGGVALFVVAVVAAITAVVLLSAREVRATDRERTAALVREAAARTEAEQASRAKSDFLAVMSHELRTPLNAIIGYQALLADGITGPVTEPQTRQLGRIKASAQHLIGLIDEILTLSRVEAGQERVRLERVDVAHALDDAASMAAPLAAARSLDFTTVPPSVDTNLTTDVAKLRQILLNLLSNAVKFTDQGSVTLDASRVDGAIRFTVRDSGPGIAPEHHERVFEEFWQVEQPTTRRTTGTGLGLAVSRRLARLLGGDLTLESRLGEGAAFTLSLPADTTDAHVELHKTH